MTMHGHGTYGSRAMSAQTSNSEKRKVTGSTPVPTTLDDQA
jgi:hypothetical protein